MAMFSSRLWRAAAWALFLVVLVGCVFVAQMRRATAQCTNKQGVTCNVLCGGQTCFLNVPAPASDGNCYQMQDGACNIWSNATAGCTLNGCTLTGTVMHHGKVASCANTCCPLSPGGGASYAGQQTCSGPTGDLLPFNNCGQSCQVNPS